MDKDFCETLYEKGIYNSPNNEIKRIDLLLEALECQKKLEVKKVRNKYVY